MYHHLTKMFIMIVHYSQFCELFTLPSFSDQKMIQYSQKTQNLGKKAIKRRKNKK